MPRAMVHVRLAAKLLRGARIQEYGRAGAGHVVQSSPHQRVEARLKGCWLRWDGPVEGLAALCLPGVEEQVHDVDVGAAQVFEEPGGHSGVAAVLVVVEHRSYVVAQPCLAKGGAKLFRRAEATVRALQLL